MNKKFESHLTWHLIIRYIIHAFEICIDNTGLKGLIKCEYVIIYKLKRKKTDKIQLRFLRIPSIS